MQYHISISIRKRDCILGELLYRYCLRMPTPVLFLSTHVAVLRCATMGHIKDCLLMLPSSGVQQWVTSTIVYSCCRPQVCNNGSRQQLSTHVAVLRCATMAHVNNCLLMLPSLGVQQWLTSTIVYSCCRPQVCNNGSCQQLSTHVAVLRCATMARVNNQGKKLVLAFLMI